MYENYLAVVLALEPAGQAVLIVPGQALYGFVGSDDQGQPVHQAAVDDRE